MIAITARTSAPAAVARPASRAAPRASRVVASAFGFPKLPFGGPSEEEEEFYEPAKPAPFSLSLPFGLGGNNSPDLDLKKAPKRKTVSSKPKTVSSPKPVAAKARVAAAPRPKSYVYEGNAGNPLKNNPFSTVEKDRPVGSAYRPSEQIDLDQIKPSIWERWGRGSV